MPGFLYLNYHHVENDVLYIGCTGSGLQFIVNIRIEIRKNVFRDKQWNMLLITERLTKKLIENMKKRLKAEKIFSPYLTEEFPNWWADLPQVLYSFFDEYDFSGKTIIPFNVHNGSRFSGTIETIQELEPEATVITDGFTVNERDVPEAADDVEDWLEGIGY